MNIQAPILLIAICIGSSVNAQDVIWTDAPDGSGCWYGMKDGVTQIPCAGDDRIRFIDGRTKAAPLTYERAPKGEISINGQLGMGMRSGPR